ncbi:hypothetical protein [Wenyingzhuangia aestuarii]|uniref:hypothetical protein n=1 Tax=Wenyingzhuangia aestuarii TaxID=1647582 RepID=UPI001439C38E|nr:hypothetical protein [Wenyingzhuangia aestuarii]NJB83667.1 hypothetical protein [Wenyingzhuangia aestuarii]
MITKISKLITAMLFFVFITTNAQYKETMNPKGFKVDLKKDYGLVNDNAKKPQGYLLQKAIDDVNSKKNGGSIYIPKGVYNISDVTLKSNVHILIEKGTVLKSGRVSVAGANSPKGPKKGNGKEESVSHAKKEKKKKVSKGKKNKKKGDTSKKDKGAKNTKKGEVTKGVFFVLNAKNGGTEYIENVSIRGVGGAFTIDYHNLKSKDRQRAIIVSMAKNFLIENMIVKDNYTVYCGITLSPSGEKVKDVKNWEVSRPTFGTIRNITHFRGSPGYGLVQCHGAQNVHYENLYSEGGVTFRLEVGANNKNVGVYDLTAKNIINKNGRCAVMLGPHSAKNGIIKVDGVTSISSTYAVKVGDGHVKSGAPDQTPGYFHDDSSITNIHAIYGKSAQIKRSSFTDYPSIEAYYNDLKVFSDYKFFEGPSIGAVENSALSFHVNISNITMEGFPYHNDKPIITHKDRRDGNWGEEKKAWEKAHTGKEFKSNKGVIAEDYQAKAYNFKRK